jgi:hypothetical protein
MSLSFAIVHGCFPWFPPLSRTIAVISRDKGATWATLDRDPTYT